MRVTVGKSKRDPPNVSFRTTAAIPEQRAPGRAVLFLSTLHGKYF